MKLTYKSFNTERVMRWLLILEEFTSPELIYIKGSKNIVADALICIDKIDNPNKSSTNSKDNKKIESILDSLSENFFFNKEDVLHPTSFKTIIRFQLKDKSLIEITEKKHKDYSINQFHGAGKTYSLICRHRKNVIPK